MDAFSVSIGLKSSKLISKREDIYFISLIGIFHFLMPYLGSLLINIIPISIESYSKYILAGIFIILSYEILTGKVEISETINYFTLLLLGLTVSIDSFTIGLGLSLVNDYNILASLIFASLSMIFTSLGLIIGKYINKVSKNKSNIIGGLILLLLGIKYLIFN